MKKVLITGANSYVGCSFEDYIKSHSVGYQIDTIDMTDDSWREKSFFGYDAILHVAGIVHRDSSRVGEKEKALYYQVNTELAVETARKAKADGVKQFILMSTAGVYGDGAPPGILKLITRETIPAPSDVYRDSKLLAEKEILPLQARHFHVVIIRPPMIYGKGCKGNYPKLSALAQRLPVFPSITNKRSMIYIDNMCEFIRLMIKNEEKGIFHPQNAEYTNTSELVQMIAEAHGKKMTLVCGFGWLLNIISHWNRKVNRAFGNFCYEEDMSRYKEEYRVVPLRESVWRTESSNAQR